MDAEEFRKEVAVHSTPLEELVERLLSRMFASLSHLTPVTRGQVIFRQLGWGGFQLSRYATYADWSITLWTGGTPGGWLAGIVTVHLMDWWYGE